MGDAEVRAAKKDTSASKKEEEAATKIQAVQRGRLGRQETVQMKAKIEQLPPKVRESVRQSVQGWFKNSSEGQASTSKSSSSSKVASAKKLEAKPKAETRANAVRNAMPE